MIIHNPNNLSGKAISKVVPESLIELLPCFDEQDIELHYGNQYLRKCENRAISIIKTKELLRFVIHLLQNIYKAE